ncbi:MAG: type I glyceraldehyde-3-phosphate dehydrogenase [Myxococcales bacterium]|nr:type I glyceraldehyde-3-phosphate dehydrogenase [Myxococcales bacterium]
MSARLPRVAINGFGRIGRALARIIAQDADCPFEWVAVNDLTDNEDLAYLLRYDSTHGRLDLPVTVTDNAFQVGDLRVVALAERDPAELPWEDLGVDIVIECTGLFRKRAQAALHLQAGAAKVVISAPGNGGDPPDATVVYGINHDTIEDHHTVISAASCTTTCLAPMVKAIDERFGLESGNMTTVHAWTADQAMVDRPHKSDPRRGRVAASNIVPTSTGAAKAIGLVIPSLEGKLHGSAIRVPVQDVSLIDLVVKTQKPATVEELNETFRAASEALPKGVLRVEDDPVVSSDLIGESTGSVIDAALTAVPGDKLIRVVSWYDNEWGYASRLYQLVSALARRQVEA